MYLVIDIGGTKTLLGLFSKTGELKQKIRFETPKTYDGFLLSLKDNVALITTTDFEAGAVGVPGRLDRDKGIAIAFGNESWRNVPIEADIEKIIKAPLVIENDAKLAGLAEANMLSNEFNKVLYITISTGIGIALITNGVIDNNLGDGGGKTLLLEHDGKLEPWENFASGRAIVNRFGKLAGELDDASAWQAISRNLAVGLLELIALTQPDVIVVGGGVGTHFEKFGHTLQQILMHYETPMMSIPPLKKATNPEEAVLYGGYQLIRSHAARSS